MADKHVVIISSVIKSDPATVVQRVILRNKSQT
jgi:hypothetical protein